MKLLSNPHGSDVTWQVMLKLKIFTPLSNPHGSDVTKIFGVSERTIYYLSNPHGSDVTIAKKNGYKLFFDFLTHTVQM